MTKNKEKGNNVPNLYRGQLCLTDPNAPWWSNWTVGASWGAGHTLGDTVGDSVGAVISKEI